MLTVQMTEEECQDEIRRIVAFIKQQLSDDEKAVLGVSGGLDSDTVARLTAEAVGSERMKIFIALQEGMDPRHLANARALAGELRMSLVEIDLVDFPFAFMEAMKEADPEERFRPDGLLDPSRAKCSVRTVVLSTYQDRGYVIVGTSNRTEWETGFFLPLGDGLAHLKPIIHLYKTQVRRIAKELGTSDAVLKQPASAGFWLGEEDLEDTAYWLFNEAPIGEEVDFDSNAEVEVASIRAQLTTRQLDLGLLGLARGMDDDTIARESGLSGEVVERLRKLTRAARSLKQRPLGVRLENEPYTTQSLR